MANSLKSTLHTKVSTFLGSLRTALNNYDFTMPNSDGFEIKIKCLDGRSLKVEVTPHGTDRSQMNLFEPEDLP